MISQETINKDLLHSLIKYIVFFNNSLHKKPRKDDKPKIKRPSKDLLEDIVNLSESNEKGVIKKPDFFQVLIEAAHNPKKEIDAAIISYSLSAERKRAVKNKDDYSVSIHYEEDDNEKKLSVKIKASNYAQNYLLKGEYSFGIKKEKETKNEAKNKANGNYSISLVYERNYERERLSISYKTALSNYLKKREDALQDFSDRVPGKHMHIMPENLMGNVLGFTYLGENFMARRADLTGKMAKMVDIHESIHTPDEYETRILTDWIMSKNRMRYIK